MGGSRARSPPSKPDYLLTWSVLGALNRGVVHAGLQWGHTSRSLRFIELGTHVMDFVRTSGFASVAADPRCLELAVAGEYVASKKAKSSAAYITRPPFGKISNDCFLNKRSMSTRPILIELPALNMPCGAASIEAHVSAALADHGGGRLVGIKVTKIIPRPGMRFIYLGLVDLQSGGAYLNTRVDLEEQSVMLFDQPTKRTTCLSPPSASCGRRS